MVQASVVSESGRYKANFTRCGLMVAESRVVADLLLRDLSAADWKHAVEVENVLAKRSASTAATDATLIRGRLRTLPRSLWNEISAGDRPVATQAVLAGVINYSPLFGDFFPLVLRDLYRRLEPTLRPQHWDRYVEDCRIRDPLMPVWSASTMDKLRTRAFAMLAEAGYLADTRGRALRPVSVQPRVARALRAAGQQETLARLCVGSLDASCAEQTGTGAA